MRRTARVPLYVPATAADPELVARWRRRWGAGGDRPVALVAGQARPDKGLDLLIAALAERRDPTLLAFVGEDLGALPAARRAAERLGVALCADEGYQPLDRFVAAVTAADVVVCPYRRASQSAVLALAAALGTPTVAADVGGLGELATLTVPPHGARALAAGVDRALGVGRVAPPAPRPGGPVAPYLAAAGVTAGAPAP